MDQRALRAFPSPSLEAQLLELSGKLSKLHPNHRDVRVLMKEMLLLIVEIVTSK